MISIRAIFTDIDGTLLNAARELSPRTIRAINAIAGTTMVVLTSSRMPAAMRHLQKALGIEGHPLICYNGGYVVAPGHAAPLSDHVIPLDVCSGIVAHAATLPIHISLYRRDDWFAQHADRWTAKEESVTKVAPQLRSFNEVLATWQQGSAGAHKIMCMGEADDVATFYNWLQERFGQRIHIYRSKDTYLELASRSVSKASAMQLVMERCFQQACDAAMAFGDNFNDVDMLRAAGVGIAVSNAVGEAKAVASEITAAGKDDGVAIAIEKHFPWIAGRPQEKIIRP